MAVLGSRLIRGHEGSEAADRARLARPLAEFLAVLHAADPGLALLRARVLAFSLSAALAVYGHHEGLGAVERGALAGLARAAVD